MDTHAQIDIPLLVGAGVLFLLGLSLVRFPKQPPPTKAFNCRITQCVSTLPR